MAVRAVVDSFVRRFRNIILLFNMERRSKLQVILIVAVGVLFTTLVYKTGNNVIQHFTNSISISEHYFANLRITKPSNNSNISQSQTKPHMHSDVEPVLDNLRNSEKSALKEALKTKPADYPAEFFKVSPPSISEERRAVGCAVWPSNGEYITDVTKKRFHFVYTRVEKTGSAAMRWLLYAFGLNHKLNMMRSGVVQDFMSTKEGEKGHHWKIGPRANEKADMVAEHAWFNEPFFKRHFHNDTVYFASVREPGSWLRSFVGFFAMFKNIQHDYHRVLADDKLFFKPANHQIVNNLRMLIRNRQLQWFGFDTSHNDDLEYLKAYIEYIDSRFSFIMVNEHYEESLLMLRRIMNWSFKDIFTRVWNPTKAARPNDGYTEEEYAKLIDRHHNLGDYMLFQYSNQSLWDKINKSPCFFEELTDFRTENKRVLEFCEKNPRTVDQIVIDTRWEPAFTWRGDDCLRLSIENKLVQKKRIDDWSHIYARV